MIPDDEQLIPFAPRGRGGEPSPLRMAIRSATSSWLARKPTEAREREYLAKGWLKRSGVSVLYGAPGSYKSFVALDLAAHVAAGRNTGSGEERTWAGVRMAPPLQEAVLYLAFEGAEELDDRLMALRRRPGGLHLDGRDSLYTIHMPREFDLADMGHVIDLEREWREAFPQGIALIVVDTLRRATRADENDGRDMHRLMGNAERLARSFGAHVMLIHHSGKDAAKGARGSTVIDGAVDTVIEVTKRDGVVTLRAAKQRGTQDGGALHFRPETVHVGTDADGDPVTSCVMLPCDPPARPERRERRGGTRDKAGHSANVPPPVPPQAQAALDVLEKALGAGHGTPNECPAQCPALPIEEWRSAFYALPDLEGRAADAKRKSFQRVRDVLAKAGAIQIDGETVCLASSDDEGGTPGHGGTLTGTSDGMSRLGDARPSDGGGRDIGGAPRPPLGGAGSRMSRPAVGQPSGRKGQDGQAPSSAPDCPDPATGPDRGRSYEPDPKERAALDAALADFRRKPE